MDVRNKFATPNEVTKKRENEIHAQPPDGARFEKNRSANCSAMKAISATGQRARTHPRNISSHPPSCSTNPRNISNAPHFHDPRGSHNEKNSQTTKAASEKKNGIPMRDRKILTHHSDFA